MAAKNITYDGQDSDARLEPGWIAPFSTLDHAGFLFPFGRSENNDGFHPAILFMDLDGNINWISAIYSTMYNLYTTDVTFQMEAAPVLRPSSSYSTVTVLAKFRNENSAIWTLDVATGATLGVYQLTDALFNGLSLGSLCKDLDMFILIL